MPQVARWPSVPYPITNGTTPATTTEPPKVGALQGAEATPTFVPAPVYQTIQIVPADSITETSTTHASITQYPGTQAPILQGHCSEPAYTILDGPEIALWVPVVGCISSKSECCATTTSEPSATTTGVVSSTRPDVQFPISFMPAQGTLTGCPKDYHTVGTTACCPSSYYLWSTSIGGQVPCYSSLAATLKAPPIPDTLVHEITSIEPRSIPSTASKPQKPTSAVVNIAYAMQYEVVVIPKKGLDDKVKIGLGVGVGVAAILIGLLFALLARKFLVHRRVDNKVVNGDSEPLKYRAVEDMEQVSQEPGLMSRSYGGTKYVGVSTMGVEH